MLYLANAKRDITGKQESVLLLYQSLYGVAILCMGYIVACQRGGVSHKPPWLQAATRHGPWILDKVSLMANYQKLKNTDRLLDPFY